MRYQHGADFRRALEDRLRAESHQTGAPLARLRKMVAFERLLARLVADRPGSWLLKGGLALQWRLADRSRTTRDLDLLLRDPVADLHALLVRSALQRLDDWFEYAVGAAPRSPSADRTNLRFPVHAMLDGRPFESFHLDVGWGDPVVEQPQDLTAPSLLAFAGLAPTIMPAYPLTQHVAEKLHAYTQPHTSGQGSRVKDLVDLLLIASLSPISARALREAVRATFDARQSHPLCGALPAPPETWATPFRRMAQDVGLLTDRLDVAFDLVCRFLNPMLAGVAEGAWQPTGWLWAGSERRPED